MESLRMRSQPLRVLGALTASAALLFTAACGAAGSATGGGGEGLDPGASKEEFIEALAEMDEVDIYLATPMPEGDTQSAAMEAYGAALEEWSGGKMNVTIGFANSLVSNAEAQDALSDGRLTMGMYSPQNDQSTFPNFSFVQSLSASENPTPFLGFLEALATYVDVGWNDEGMVSDAEAVGIKPLFPMILSSPVTGVLCPEPETTLADIRGKTVMSSTPAIVDATRALGMVPETLPSDEAYEAMQRGVMECAAAVLGLVIQQDLASLAPHYMLSDDAGMAYSAFSVGISKVTYDSLPLAAQQLMWDRVDVYLEERLREVFARDAQGISALKEAGGGAVEWGDDVVEALNQYNSDLRAGARDRDVMGVDNPSRTVDLIEESSSTIPAKVRDLDLGVTDEPSYANIDTWWTENERSINLEPFTELIMSDIMSDHRPG